MPEIALETLRARALASYERGRLRTAAHLTWVIAPLIAVCAHETGAYKRCAVTGLVLLAVAIAVAWRQRRGVRAAHAGVLTGVLPMVSALVLCRLTIALPREAAIGICTAAGVAAGALASSQTMGAIDAEWPQWASAALIAGLTGALGCVGIGFGTAIGAGAGVAAGAVVATWLPRHV